jgi:hypothetical protein
VNANDIDLWKATSAKTGFGVMELFQDHVAMMVDLPSASEEMTVTQEPPPPKTEECC